LKTKSIRNGDLIKFALRICLKKKDKQWSTKHYTGHYKWNRTIPFETMDALRCFIRIFSSCSTSDTCCLNDMLSINKTFDTNVANCCMFIFQNQIDDDSTVLSFFDRGLMLWCLTPHSTICHDGQFYWWRKPEGRQVTPLRHIILNSSQPVFAFIYWSNIVITGSFIWKYFRL
jgi:hypothetical protein